MVKILNKKNVLKQTKLFSLVYILGKTSKLEPLLINSLLHKNYSKKLSFYKLKYMTYILRIKKIYSLNKFLMFHIFFFNNIQKNILGFNQKLNRWNSLKNNFKLFIYSLYTNNNFIFYNNFTNKNLLSLNTNNYFPYEYYNVKSNSSHVYNFLFNDSFNFNNLSEQLKFNNFNYLRSNKKKRFKKKQSEKLAALRENLDNNKEYSFRLKFYYKFYDYKRLHPYWDKEAFLNKKFKYFNPGKESFLLYFFYKYRKNKALTNKYELFTKKWFINFWLQAKIRKYGLTSYNISRKNKKSQYKLTSFYFKKIIKNTILFNNKKEISSLNTKLYKYNLRLQKNYSNEFLNSYLKNNVPKILSLKFKNSNTLLDNQLNGIINFNNNNINNNKFFNKKILLKFKKLSNTFLNKYTNDHIFFNNKKIKNFKRFNKLPSTYKYNNFYKRKGKPYFFLNDFYSDYSDKKAFYVYAKKSKPFRKKVKLWNWLNKQKNFKSWKFEKFLIYKKLWNSNFKKNVLFLNTKKIYLNKKNPKIIFDNKSFSKCNRNYSLRAKSQVLNWIAHDFNFYNKLNSYNLNYFSKSLNFICAKYEKNFSNFRSNKVLNKKYAYMNLFKGFKVFKKKNQSHFFLSKLSKKLFLKSWNIVKKSYKRKNKRSFLNLVPSYNQLFIKRVLKIYKLAFFSKLLNSNMAVSKKINSIDFKKYFNLKKKTDLTLKNKNFLIYQKSLFLNNSNLNIINSVKNIRFIDKNYGFNKRKEKELKIRINNFKNDKYILKNKLLNLERYLSKNNNNNFLKLKKKYLKDISFLNNNINKIELLLKFLFNSKKDFIKNYTELSYYNFKNQKLKYKTFYNYFQSLNIKKRVNSFDTFYNNILLNSKSIINNYSPFSFIKPIKKVKKNLNKIRKVLLNNTAKNKLYFNNINKLFHNLKVSKFKSNKIINYNWSLNNLLQKNYNVYLKLFKYFNFYKKANTFDYFWGFGKLWNYCNVNHENIFSWFNFFNYNFLNHNHWKKELGISNDYFGNIRYFDKVEPFWKKNEFNLRKIELLFPLDSPEKFEELILRYTTPVNELFPSYDKINKTQLSSLMECDILNKPNKLARILYTKNYVSKYFSILNNNLLPYFLKLLNNKSDLIKYSLTSRYYKNTNFLFNTLNTEICVVNLFLLKNKFNSLGENYFLIMNNNDKPFKKLYYGLLKGYNNIFNIT